jgi:hypothetical protein
MAALKGIALAEKSVKLLRSHTSSTAFGRGVFKVSNNQYDTLSVPRAGAIASEGLLKISQKGIFVAVPNGATNVEVKIIQKKMQVIPGSWKLKPVQKPITEKEYLAGKKNTGPKKMYMTPIKCFSAKILSYCT